MLCGRGMLGNVRLAGCLLLIALQSCGPSSVVQWAGIESGKGPAQLVVFGDSLSDTGNFKDLSPGAWQLEYGKYDDGRFTCGAFSQPRSKHFQQGVWHEVLMAPPFGVSSVQGTLNYAFGGATTGPDTHYYKSNGVQTGVLILDLGHQIDRFLAATGNTAPAENLYVVWAGANDVIDAAEQPGVKPSDTRSQAIRSASLDAFTNARNEVHRLAAAGATRIIWGNLPPVHASIWADQFAEAPDCSQALQDAVESFDKSLDNAIPVLESEFQKQGLTIYKFDAKGLLEGILTDAYANGGGQYGITNFWAEASQIEKDSSDVDDYFFWDSLHPTSHVHAILGEAVYRLLAGTTATAVTVAGSQ